MSNEKRSVTSARSIRRGDAVAIDASLQTGNLVRLKDPNKLTLVGSPANQTGFKVLRSDEGEKPMSPPVIRRTRRSEASPVLRLSFPEGHTDATVAEALKTYGLSGYRIEEVEGVFTATRADLQSISEDTTVEVKLSDEGLTATVARQAPSPSNAGEKPNVSLVSIEFDGSKFTKEEVQRWATEKSVDGEVQDPENEGDCYVVRRSAPSENEETRRLTLEDGVTAVIVRSDVADIPAGYYLVVNETAYGNWGWGQLDFAAKMADKVFSEQMEDAIYSLRSVLQDIMLYSPLPLDVRKDLTNRALAQFGEYVGAVMDSLPRQLLVSVTRSANPLKEKVMSKEASGAAPNQAATETPKTEAPLTRADVESMINTAVAALAPKTEAAPAAAAEAAPAAVEATVGLTRADLTAAFSDALKPLAERMEKLEGTTVVRSAPEQLPEKKEVKKEDLFRGALPGISKRSKD